MNWFIYVVASYCGNLRSRCVCGDFVSSFHNYTFIRINLGSLSESCVLDSSSSSSFCCQRDGLRSECWTFAKCSLNSTKQIVIVCTANCFANSLARVAQELLHLLNMCRVYYTLLLASKTSGFELSSDFNTGFNLRYIRPRKAFAILRFWFLPILVSTTFAATTLWHMDIKDFIVSTASDDVAHLF